jgi:hypothetical protein
MKISYAITVKDEIQEIKTLLTKLFNFVRKQDEVVVLWDEKNGDPQVWEYLNSINSEKINIYKGSFQGHFANWKNYLNSLCRGDVIINLDADEIPHEFLLQNLPEILENSEVDLIYVPRVNTVEGITQEHIDKWGWKINEKGWVNYPDHQARIYKRDPNINWSGKVHETIKGFKSYGVLPLKEEFSLYHPKTIKKQEKQNKYYNTL